MRVEGSEQTTGRWQDGTPRDPRRRPGGAGASARSDSNATATGTIAGAGRQSVDTVVPTEAESTHVEGGAADVPARFAWSLPPESVPLAGGTVLTLAPPLAAAADTPASTAIIQMLDGGERAAALVSLAGSGMPVPDSVARFARPLGMAEESVAPPIAALDARHVTWRDPASVEGAVVLAIGGATLVLSNLG